MKDPVAEWFPVGVVVGTHGLRGDLKVRPMTAGSPALLTAGEVCLRDRTGLQRFYERSRAVLQKGKVLLRLRGLDNIDAVVGLVGCEVLMRYAELPELESEEFYWYELQGLKVVDQRRGELGILEHLLATGAHDIYVVNGRFGEVMIPAVGRFVLKVDLAAGRMIVDLPEGLVAETNEL